MVASALGTYLAVRVRDPALDWDVYVMFLEVAGDDAFGLVAGIHDEVGAACVETTCHVQGAIR